MKTLQRVLSYRTVCSMGTIPTELGNLSALENFQFSFSSFLGSIPSELGELLNLREFTILLINIASERVLTSFGKRF